MRAGKFLKVFFGILPSFSSFSPLISFILTLFPLIFLPFHCICLFSFNGGEQATGDYIRTETTLLYFSVRSRSADPPFSNRD